MNGNGMPSPEEIERARLYYGGASLTSPASAPAPDPVASFGPPPPPPIDAGPMYNYAPPPDPVAPPKQFSWNAPGHENAHAAPFSGTSASPPAPAAPPAPVGPATDASIPPPPPARVEGEGRAPGTTLGTKAIEHYGGEPGPAKAAGGRGGPAGPRGPSAYERAQGAFRGTYDDDKAAMQRGAGADEARADLLSVGAAEIAQKKQNDELVQKMEAANAARHFEDFSAETQRQIDDVRSKVIEPNGRYADTGSAIMAVIGGALGGLYQGMNKLSSNPFIDQMNKNIDRDIAVQEKNLNTKKEGVGERKGLLAEMRATYKDEALAKIQARNLYYEGAKEELAARAAAYDSPAIQARTDQAISAISREQAKLDVNEAVRKAAAAAAAGAAAEHRRQIDFENRLKLQDMQNKTVTANAGAQKDLAEGGKHEAGDVARFVSTGKDKDGNPTGYLERNPEGATNAQEGRAARAELRSEIENALKIRNDAGRLGRTLNRNDPNQSIQLYTPEWQTNIRQSQAKITSLINKAGKLGTIDAGTIPLLHAQVGDLETRGGEADDRLHGLLGQLDRSEQAAADTASGARATKYVGQDGREHVAPHGSSNAPNNPRTVAREPVK